MPRVASDPDRILTTSITITSVILEIKHTPPWFPNMSIPIPSGSPTLIYHYHSYMSSSNIITPWFGLYPSGVSWSSSSSDVDHPSGSSLHSTERAMAIRAMHDGIWWDRRDQWLDACGWWVWWEGVTWCDLEINTRGDVPSLSNPRINERGLWWLWHSQQPWTWHLFTNTHIQHLHTNILQRPTNDQQANYWIHGIMGYFGILVEPAIHIATRTLAQTISYLCDHHWPKQSWLHKSM